MEENQLHKENSFFGRSENYLREFVYGGIDGAVTTFAVVAGAVGANLDAGVIIILGFANLFADGFSMSVGAYLSAKSEIEHYKKHRKIEYKEIETMPEMERKEVEDIYRAKGFEGELLKQVVDVIVSDKDRWVDEMMKNELEMIPDSKSPLKIGTATLASFIMVGFIPLLIYCFDYFRPLDFDKFFWTSALTGAAFITVGWLKSYVNETNTIKSIGETLLLGVVAALVAYFVGDLLEGVIMNHGN